MTSVITQSIALVERLREQIRRAGPLTFCDWMTAALYDPLEGYYCKPEREKWGRRGDYRTSPERSSLFASTFARYFAKLYEQLNSPAEWTVVEPGAGEGRFAELLLENLQIRFPKVFSATHYIIDELSEDSRRRSNKQLAPFADRIEFKSLSGINRINHGVIFSNELLDALPVHRVTMRKGELNEFYVGVDAEERFEWIAGPPSTPRLTEFLKDSKVQLSDGQIAEVNLGIEDWFKLVADKLEDGYLITVDYGAEADELYDPTQRPQGTLRSFYSHQFVDDVLTRPGEQDITSSVDWTHVKGVGKTLGFEVLEFSRQDDFMLKAGLLEELELQSQIAGTDAEKLALSIAAKEMILPSGMAASFQVLVQKKTSEN